MADVNQQAIPPQPPPYLYQQPRRSRWWIPLLIVGIIIVLFILGVIAFFSVVSSVISEQPTEVKQNSVLYIKLDKPVEEYYSPSLFDIFGVSGQPTHYDILLAVKKAAKDDRIKGIFINSGIQSLGFAKAEEFINAIDEFRKSGKFVYGYMEMGDEASYMNLVASDKIFVPTEGLVEMNGFAASNLFFKQLLDTLGIDIEVIGFEDFKSAGESFSRTNFSDSAKLQTRALIQGRQEIFCNLVSKYRKMTSDKVLSVLNSCQYNPDSLKRLGFIDDMLSETEVRKAMKEKIYGAGADNDRDKSLHLIKVTDYLKSDFNDDEPVETEKQIAVIYGVGQINVATDDGDVSGKQEITARTFIKYLTEAREDESISIIILRIDSPGGSAMVSDEIYQEILRTRKVKPVYASMGDVAASGGYYIAVASDTIIADASTITGSIGVITALPSVSRMLKKIHLSVDTVTTTASAMTLKAVYPIGDKERVMMRSFADGIYKRFLSKVAAGRKMSVEQVRGLAKGRVWSGKDAKRIGLIDAIGGLNDAIAMAKKRIGVPVDKKVIIRHFPEKKDPFQALLEIFGASDDNDISACKANYSKIGEQLAMKNSSVAQLLSMFPSGVRNQIIQFGGILDLVNSNEKALTVMPVIINMN